MVARLMEGAYASSEVSFAGDGAIQAVALTWTPLPNKTYAVLMNCFLQRSAGTWGVAAEFYSAALGKVNELVWWPNDNASPLDYMACSHIQFFNSGASPVSQTYRIEVESFVAGTTVKGKEASITAVALNADDISASGTSFNTGTFPTTMLSATFTPASTADYLIIACANVSTADTVTLQLEVDGVAVYGTADSIRSESSSEYTWCRAAKVNLSNTSHTVRIRALTGTINFNSDLQRILCLRLAGDVSYYTENLTTAGGTETSFTDVLSLTQSINAGNHLEFFIGKLDPNSNSQSASGQAVRDGSGLGRMDAEGAGASNATNFFYNLMRLSTLGAGSHTWKYQRLGEGQTVDADGAIAILQAGVLAAAAATFSGAGAATFGAAARRETTFLMSGASALMFIGAGGVAAPFSMIGISDVVFRVPSPLTFAIGGASQVSFDATYYRLVDQRFGYAEFTNLTPPTHLDIDSG